MSQSRQLAAIMFTDIVGYTALMGDDEQKAFELLNKNRLIQKPIIQEFNGRWIKELGDGVMASFNSVSNAVNAAIKIQEACNASKDFQLRIGIHQGEVVFENDDVFGDGVNIASRIEPLASPGGIIITEAVFQNLQNKKGIETGFLGEQKLKNVHLPVKLYAVILPGIKNPSFSQKKEKKFPPKWIYIVTFALILLFLSILIWEFYPAKILNNPIGNSEIIPDYISIAVLPFINRSNDPEQEYFSDGITEEIITQLAKIGDLSVTSSRSVFTYKNNLKDIPTIGEELGVSYILEGNVRKQGDKLRITTQLVNTKTDKNLWVNDFDREIIELLDIQIDVAKKVANALNIKLTQPEIDRIERKSTEKFSAYDYYLKAIHEDKKWTGEGMNKTLEYLEMAIALDPEFSEAYSLYAWQYVHLATITGMDPKEAFANALPAVKNAIKYDSLSSDAYLVYGSVNFFLDWNFEEARNNFEKSMELNSWGESPIYQCICAYVEFLLSNGEIEEIWNLFDNINRIDPNFFLMFEYESYLHILNNDMESAIIAFEKRLPYSDTLDWHFNTAYGTLFYLTGHYEEAVNKLEKSLFLEKDSTVFTLLYLSLSYIHLNKMDEALKIHQELIERDMNGEYGMKTPIAVIYNELEDEEKTFEYLEKAYQAREYLLLWLKVAHFKNLSNHPRYLSLLRKIGFET